MPKWPIAFLFQMGHVGVEHNSMATNRPRNVKMAYFAFQGGKLSHFDISSFYGEK